jgi:tRNA threonylcarbamoyladenosine biosynthesis protein TsaE
VYKSSSLLCKSVDIEVYVERKIMNEEQARLFGVKLAEGLNAGAVIALTGEPGSGKTTLTKAIAEGLRIDDIITSPTFTIINEYRGGRLPLYHFDVYRLTSYEDMYNLGYEEYFYGSGVTVIEWADLIEDLLPENSILIHIKYSGSIAMDERVYEIITHMNKTNAVYE